MAAEPRVSTRSVAGGSWLEHKYVDYVCFPCLNVMGIDRLNAASSFLMESSLYVASFCIMAFHVCPVQERCGSAQRNI